MPLVLENDADAAALGIQQYGDVGETENIAYLTLSTGIGSGVIRNGELVPGVEAGFLNLDWDGTIEHVGVKTPWEGYTSGGCFTDRLAAWLRDREPTTDTALRGDESAKEFFEVVYDGDEVARQYYTRLKRINAAGIGTLSNLFSTELIRVGGGIGRPHPRLTDYLDLPYVTEPVDLSEYTLTPPPPVIEQVELDEDLELYGAAAAALQSVR